MGIRAIHELLRYFADFEHKTGVLTKFGETLRYYEFQVR